MAAFVMLASGRIQSFLRPYLSKVSFIPEPRGLYRLGLYKGDLNGRKECLLRRDFSTKEVRRKFHGRDRRRSVSAV